MEYCDIHTTLERAGLSKTSQRVAVLTALVHAQTPLSAKDILDRVSGDSRVNKVTIYRILSSFKAGSIIREIATDHGVNFFEMACRHNPTHPHFYCRVCRSLSCLPEQVLRESRFEHLLTGRETVDGITLNLTGVCGSCNRRRASHR